MTSVAIIAALAVQALILGLVAFDVPSPLSKRHAETPPACTQQIDQAQFDRLQLQPQILTQTSTSTPAAPSQDAAAHGAAPAISAADMQEVTR